MEPYVTPKHSLTGSSAERVDARVLQIIFKFPNELARRIYVRQHMDLFSAELHESRIRVSAHAQSDMTIQTSATSEPRLSLRLVACLPYLLWCLLGLDAGSALAGELRAGAATSNITPPLGIEINGGTAPVIATHVHDELHARALVLDDGSTRLA